MIPLTDEQRKCLHTVTCNLLSVSAGSNALVISMICDALEELYRGVLGAAEEEMFVALDYADKQLRAEAQLEATKGALH